jgi:DNA-directed RNA polymerase alpha subunit
VAEHSENDIPITELEVSVEVRALLRNVGIELIRDLKGKTADELMAIPGLDREQVEQIRGAAARRGYLLG